MSASSLKGTEGAELVPIFAAHTTISRFLTSLYELLEVHPFAHNLARMERSSRI